MKLLTNEVINQLNTPLEIPWTLCFFLHILLKTEFKSNFLERLFLT